MKLGQKSEFSERSLMISIKSWNWKTVETDVSDEATSKRSVLILLDAFPIIFLSNFNLIYIR